MRKCPNGNFYEYIGTYVDDLCLVMKNPQEFLDALKKKPYSFKLKGSGPLTFHLGCGFSRDSSGTLCMDPGKYIDKMELAYEQLFHHKPSQKVTSPLEKGDHPELDTSSFLDEEDTMVYQSLIGAMQWSISIGRFDIATAVMSLSSFRAMPRRGHLERVKRVYGYLCKFRHFKIRFRTEEPDYSGLNLKKYDWANTAYGNPSEELPKDAPPPLGKRITLTHYFDANLMHDVLSGKAVTGILYFYNKNPVNWYCKKQATSETATYGAGFVSGRTCVEQTIDHVNSLRYLGVPINNISYVFGDNESMINSSTVPHARLNTRHNILSYHFVRSMVACGYIITNHLRSDLCYYKYDYRGQRFKIIQANF